MCRAARSVCLLLLMAQWLSMGWAITNNADLVWYEKDSDQPHYYVARDQTPEGLIKAVKIVVNQKLPLIWEVKFAFFDNLEVLIIEGCGVNEVRPGSFRDLKPLTNLSLGGNNIKAIKEKVFNFVEIKNLNFSHNKIAIVEPGAFDNMPVLESIILDFNELKQWHSDWFTHCANLRKVSVTHNFLDELPERAFRNLWSNATTVVSLYFGYNKIKEVHQEALAESKQFADLFFDWNEIEECKGLDDLDHVKSLNLDGNSLRCLSESLMNDTSRIEVLSLRNNPLKCVCYDTLKNQMKNRPTNKIILSEREQSCS